jgi:hypothetical protein
VAGAGQRAHGSRCRTPPDRGAVPQIDGDRCESEGAAQGHSRPARSPFCSARPTKPPALPGWVSGAACASQASWAERSRSRLGGRSWRVYATVRSGPSPAGTHRRSPERREDCQGPARTRRAGARSIRSWSAGPSSTRVSVQHLPTTQSQVRCSAADRDLQVVDVPVRLHPLHGDPGAQLDLEGLPREVDGRGIERARASCCCSCCSRPAAAGPRARDRRSPAPPCLATGGRAGPAADGLGPTAMSCSTPSS